MDIPATGLRLKRVTMMSDYPDWHPNNELRYSDADDPFAIYCPVCGGTGIDKYADTNGLPPYDGWDDEYPPCAECHGQGLLYNDDYQP